MKKDVRWLLFVTAIIGIIGCTDALKATSLIFGNRSNPNRTTTTTTTTTTTEAVAVNTKSEDDVAFARKDDDAAIIEETETKPTLTGIPQIDYVWDPNLPRELNGFNLSTYPFLNSVPDNDDIDFKCDGLHDGFYASIKYSCQLYHHCVYGIRHDFLCANFTAFDQKSFICQFVSEVNCKSSAKYWFRNDALYKATTTTSTTTTTLAPPPTTSRAPLPPERPRRPGQGRRPVRRRRPQQDYYYDDYEEYDNDYPEERYNRRRKPNRQRNRRPEYDDEDDYGSPRVHKPVDDSYEDARPVHRERNRNTKDDELDDYEYERRSYERPRNNNRSRLTEGRRNKDEERRPMFNERRSSKDRRPSVVDDDDEKESHINDRRTSFDDRRGNLGERRPIVDDRRSNADDKKPNEPRRGLGERRRPYADRKPLYDDEEDDYDSPPPRKHIAHSPAAADDAEEEMPVRYQPPEPKNGVVPKVRSTNPVASIFSKPRAPPRISRPVPSNEKKKYEYVSTKAPAAVPASYEDQYDEEYDYEAEVPKAPLAKSQKVETKVPKAPPPKVKVEQRKPVQTDFESKSHSFESEELEEEVVNISSRNQNKKPEEKVPRNPSKIQPEISRAKSSESKIEAKPAETFEDEDEEFAEYADVEPDQKEETESQEEHKPAQKPDALPPQSKPLTLETEPNRSSRPQQYRFPTHAVSPPQPKPTYAAKQQSSRPAQSEPVRDVYSLFDKEQSSTLPEPSGFKPVGYNREQYGETDNFRPSVRVVKRPFLPSRGGSPYLPRGLKPVGVGISNVDYRSPTNIDQSHITGVLVQSSQPHERVNYNSNQQTINIRPTHRPQETLRTSLDDIYNSDYDVTINDALNPTLKPISQSHETPVTYTLSKYDRSNPYARSDASHASSVFRSTSIQAPFYVQSRNRRPSQHQQEAQASRQSQQYYDDYDYS